MLTKRAQNINEYAMVIVVVTLAAVAMQAHIKRGIQAVIKLTADDLVTGWKLTEAPKPPEVLPDGKIKESELHLTAKEYKEINGGYVWGERQGNRIYYYHFTSNPADKTIIGIEDSLTGDYTEFGSDGFAIGVTHKVNIRYDLKFKRNEDAKTHETVSVTVYERIYRDDVEKDKAIYSDTGTTYGKYERVRLSSGAAGEVTAQQKGVEEPGLYDYKQIATDASPTGALIVTNKPSPKTVTVTEFALSNVTIPYTSYNDYIRKNFGKAAVKTEIKGNNINYYLITTDSLIGTEDAFTRDLTIFDKDGFVNWVFSENGPYKDTEIKLTSNYDPVEPTKVIGVRVQKKVDGKWVDVGTYGKYQPVIISQAAATNPFSTEPLPEIAARKTVSSETTNVSGSWTATYKLGAETFGSLEKKKLGDTTSLTSGTGKKPDGT